MKKRLTMLLLSAGRWRRESAMLAQAPPASTTLSVRGTIDNYDASSRNAVAVDVEPAR